ncbi:MULTISPECIES: glycosyl transferase [unclassified Rhodanobacter]|uniref:glycosyl transferase n=1 Tax=unclassified Rhodanobacter TaxID=2621553 RepID=UPI0020C257A4|nr:MULTISPECIES: glycosyl transferase [unclassified Rhodanobacter]
MVRKINLFIFATHHSSNNIASQRFKGLVKYLDFQKYRVFIFSREPKEEASAHTFHSDADITVMNFPGHCVGNESSALGSLLALLSAFFSFAPFLVNRLFGRSNRAWLIHALVAADTLCRERLKNGEPCIAIGTYSPIDALVAARCLSVRHQIPCQQDFRDGLTFEALGKQGRFRSLMKALVEERVVSESILVTSVSRALVDDFERRYAGKKVGLMPNGYDPADFIVQEDANSVAATNLVAQKVPPDKHLIGHFGRISASDQTRIGSLECFVRSMNASAGARQYAHALFVGELTAPEHDIISRLECTYSTVDSVARPVALRLMKHCEILLLITGDGTGCATGKLFEYLAAGSEVICFSGVVNEASHILSETGAGETVLKTEDAKAQELLNNVFTASRHTIVRRKIGVYSKVEQVKQFDRWLTGMVA